MIYRKEIDGLRALAVIPVILFHAGFEFFSGGFVGVDIFFVISGYLITCILLAELDAGTFTIAGFYERRIRRIFPALFFVIIATIPFAYYWLLPNELAAFGKSIMSISVFASNIFFWQESDYFAADAEFLPLLHTWSLAVEEQYYLFFPIIMMLLWSLGKKSLVAIFMVFAVLSIGISEWAWRYAPEFNFYMLPTRMWELLAGALVAFYLSTRTPHGNQLGSSVGLLAILGAVFFYDTGIPIPSLYGLLPIVGTVLIILFATQDTLVGKLLSLKPMVAIGLISYSAYLWHQPLFVFTRLSHLEEPSSWLLCALGIVALLMAWFSWHFVEKPFRNKKHFTQRQVLIAGLLISILFILIGASLAQNT